jgi:hypothetical protein
LPVLLPLTSPSWELPLLLVLMVAAQLLVVLTLLLLVSQVPLLLLLSMICLARVIAAPLCLHSQSKAHRTRSPS